MKGIGDYYGDEWIGGIPVETHIEKLLVWMRLDWVSGDEWIGGIPVETPIEKLLVWMRLDWVSGDEWIRGLDRQNK